MPTPTETPAPQKPAPSPASSKAQAPPAPSTPAPPPSKASPSVHPEASNLSPPRPAHQPANQAQQTALNATLAHLRRLHRSHERDVLYLMVPILKTVGITTTFNFLRDNQNIAPKVLALLYDAKEDAFNPRALALAVALVKLPGFPLQPGPLITALLRFYLPPLLESILVSPTPLAKESP